MLQAEEVRNFCQKKIAADVSLKHDVQFSLIAGGLDWTGSFKKFQLWTYHDHHALLKPGFLDPIVQDNAASYLGARIEFECRCASDDPRDWFFGDAVIIEVKSRQSQSTRTILGLLGVPRKAAPVDDRTFDETPAENGADAEASKTRKRL